MVGDRLRAIRINKGFTLQQTADELGLTLRSYQKYEGCEREPSLSMLIRIADLWNVPTDFLLERDSFLISLGVCVDVSLECPPRRPKPQKNRSDPHTQSSDNVLK